MNSTSHYFIALILILSIFACNDGGEDNTNEPRTTDFDRGAMLTDWADHLIIPAYESFATTSNNLNEVATAFSNDITETNLSELQATFRATQLAWQKVSMFELGPAESVRLRNQVNIYPANISEIQANAGSGNANLTLPSQIDRQGLPAIEYLLFGVGETNNEIIEFYGNSNSYLTYLLKLTERLDSLAADVVAEWKGGYRNQFISNDGNSATASIDRLVNDYLFYYEKALRAGKVGIPAGVFSGTALPDHVEAFYQKEQSKALFIEALDATQDFFNGQYYDGSQRGVGLSDYLDFIATTGNPNAEGLADRINAQFDTARNQANQLEGNFSQQIENDLTSFLKLYDELQKNVVNMKVDMLQALNINVDFVDADGD